MKAEHPHYVKDLREGLQNMFNEWWDGKEISPHRRRQYYELKEDYLRVKIKNLRFLAEKAGIEVSDYSYEEMNRFDL